MRRALVALLLIAACSTIASAQQYTYYFPHIASGFGSALSWKTTIFISNSSASFASGSITFTDVNGGPFNVAFIDDVARPIGGGNAIPFQLGPGETRKYESVVNGPLMTGFATVTANAAVLGTAMFTQYDANGRMLGEAGVPAAIPLGKQAIFVDTTGGYKTGVAIANPNTAALHIHFELVNTMGQVVAAMTRDLPPFQQFSIFIHELFPAAPGMVGRLQFWCTNPMTAIGLRFDPSGALFTTLPPIAIAGLIQPAVRWEIPGIVRRERLLS